MRGQRAGLMRQRVTLLQRTKSEPDEYGSEVIQWLEAYPNLAAGITIQGRAFEAAQQRQQELTHLIVIRWIPELTLRALSLMRIQLLDGAVLEQLSPPLDRELANREITLNCKRRLSDDDQ